MQYIAILEVVRWTIQGVGDALPVAFRAFSQAAAPLVVTALWQGAAVASALAICLRLAPRMSAAHRFALWSAGFVALVCLPFLPLFSRLNLGSVPSAVPSGLAEAASKPWLQLDIRWSLAIAALWAAASMFRGIDLAIHSRRLRRLWKTALPIERAGNPAFSLVSMNRLPGRRPVQLCTTRHLDRPSVIGFFAPRILIPEWLLARLTPEELEQIVLHEAEHLRRNDDWSNLFQKLCLVLFPLNPALWWIERRLCAEREMACDDAVIRITRAPRAYAACLTSLAERGLQRRAEALSLGAWQRRPELVHRVHSILTRHHALSPLATRALLGTLASGLAFGSVELAQCPQLIAFVPAHQAEATQSLIAARSQTESPHLLNTAYVVDRQPLFARNAHGFHAANAKAIMPESHGTTLVPVHPAVKRTVSKPANEAGEMNASSSLPAFNSPKQEKLKAEMPGPQQDSSHQQEWIVLTTWEQVQTSDRAVPESSDYDAAQSTAPATSDAKDQPNGHVTNEITVTRLIFRVIPISSTSAQPGVVPVHAGWFVLQL